MLPVSLIVEAGQCVFLSGVSGSGKSLLLRAIADLDCFQGEVLLDDVSSMLMSGSKWRQRVAYLPAESQWWFDSVAEHFADVPAENKLSMLGFDRSIMDASVHNLSSGERQRLALLRMMLNQPDVLLLDEPTASLDPENTRQVEALISSYCLENNAAVLWVSHDPEQISRIADRHVKLDDGKLLRVS